MKSSLFYSPINLQRKNQPPHHHEIREGLCQYVKCLYTTGLFFHRFFKITNKWISRILEFRKKSLSLGKKSLSLGGKFLSLGGEFSSFMWKLTIFALKLHKNGRIFEFGFKTCLSLEKILEFRKKS